MNHALKNSSETGPARNTSVWRPSESLNFLFDVSMMDSSSAFVGLKVRDQALPTMSQ